MNTIPYYGIYGDIQQSDDPDFLHIEKMGERGQAIVGNAAPHAHRNMFQLFFALEGSCTIQIEETCRSVTDTCLVYIPGNTVHSFNFDKKSIGWIITSSERLLAPEANSPIEPFFVERLWRFPAIIPYQEGADDTAQMRWLMQQIEVEFQGSNPGRTLALESLVKLALIHFRRKLVKHANPLIQKNSERELFLEFRRLVEQQYSQHLSIDDYAEQLKVNTFKLKKACINFTEKSAHELIQERLALEAQRLLIYTSASAVEIATELGFQDPAYFNRFIKRRLGLPPLKFRQQKQTEQLQQSSN